MYVWSSRGECDCALVSEGHVSNPVGFVETQSVATIEIVDESAARFGEKPLILRRRGDPASGTEPAEGEFDPVSDDVLRRYRAYADELAALGPQNPTS